MKLLLQLAHNQARSLGLVMLLSMTSAILTVSVIAFIQYKLLDENTTLIDSIMLFFGLLAALLITATAAQISLHKLGHKFVYEKRCQIVKQLINTDIEQVEAIGGARLLASLNTDIRNITVAFVHLPELIYGLILSIIAMAFLAFLSVPLFGISLMMLTVTGMIGFWLVGRITYHIRQVREYDDKLYQDYQAFIDGRKELSLNPGRAKRYFTDEFDIHAQEYRHQVVQADILNGFAANMANTVVLALIGLNYYFALGLGWANFQVASSFALVILFIRTPLMTAIGSLPALVAANVSMKKLSGLSLNTNEALSKDESLSTKQAISRNESLNTNTSLNSNERHNGPHSPHTFNQLILQQVTYQYRAEGDEQPFQIGPIDLTINKGELIFIIGGNGSGKSTFAQLLTGLYRPHAGQVLLDGELIEKENWHTYRRYFSAVFSDFHLFHQITDSSGSNVNSDLINEWMSRLEMQHKVSHADGFLSDTRYSQGQRKRLAFLMAVMEQRGCLLLDEWAADQDPRFRQCFYRELLPLLKERGITVIAITHDDKYFDGADRVLKMDNGQLTELSTHNNEQINEAINQVAVG